MGSGGRDARPASLREDLGLEHVLERLRREVDRLMERLDRKLDRVFGQ